LARRPSFVLRCEPAVRVVGFSPPGTPPS
jgi:hypothetical protein